jgi:Spy/CpxP family protein refolding chaperone
VAAQAPAQAPQQRNQAHVPRAKGERGEFGKQLNRQLFKGIDLSATEKANLKAVREKYAPQMKALRQQMKPELQQVRQARERGDTASLKNLRNASAPQRDQARKLLEAERNDFRNALAPQNRAKFDANVTRLDQRVAKRSAQGWTKGHKADGK